MSRPAQTGWFLLGALAFLAGCDVANEPLPFDAQVLRGRLDNGLAYYVRRNEKPKNRLELRLVVKAGSVLEDDDQQGLAHLLEHMAFNGTERFDRQKLVDYLESIGMRFGPELNAYTSFDETVYMLQVPTDREGAVDTAFAILRDWAFGIRNEDAEVLKERGVVIEEWRLGRGAAQRIRDRQFPVALRGSRYAERLPIGKKETLESAPPGRLRDFYRAWYRPDLMAVVAVGPVEPGLLLKKVRDAFGTARPAAAPPRPRPVWPVPDHPETLVSAVGDAEATRSSVAVHFKLPVRPSLTVGDYRRDLVDALFTDMLNRRLDERRQQADAPFLGAHVSRGRWVLTKEYLSLAAQVSDDGFERGLEALVTEAERVRRHGFTPGELARGKREALAAAEKAYRERDTTESRAYVGAYARAFTWDAVEPGVEAELELHRRLLPEIGLGEVNGHVRGLLIESNRVILASGPQKPEVRLPAEDALRGVFARVAAADVPPYEDDVPEGPFVPRPPTPGTVVDTARIPEVGLTVWRLSNGARVLFKPTPFKKDQILFSAWSAGGHSRVSDADFVAAAGADAVVAECGLGTFRKPQIEKKLAGKVASVRASIDELREGLSGSCRPEDIRDLLELAYLHVTAPRRDPDAYGAHLRRLRTQIEHRLASPETAFGDEMAVTLNRNHLRRRPWTLETLQSMDLDRCLALYAERFSAGGPFTFLFVGDIDPERVRADVLTFLGGLPAGRDETWRDVGVRPFEGTATRVVRRGQDPKSRVQIVYAMPFAWSRAERHRVQSLVEALKIRLREKLREEMSGTYHTHVYASFQHYPDPRCQIGISLGCPPERVDVMIEAIRKELAAVQTEGIDDACLTKVKQIQLREREVSLERNEFWQSLIDFCEWNGEDLKAAIADFPAMVASLTRDGLRDTARAYLSTPNVATFILRPEKD